MKLLVTVFALLCASNLATSDEQVSLRQQPCVGLPGGTGFVNDYSGCSSYFSCVNYTPFRTKCPLPFFFNPHGPFGPICDWPQNVHCQPCPETGMITIPDAYSCTKYRQCVNGIAMERECAPGTAFDYDKGMCVPNRDALCTHVNTCGQLQNGAGNAPSTEFCDMFVVCYNWQQFGEPISCPQGLKFDSVHNRCAIPEDGTEFPCYPGTLGITQSSLPHAPIRRFF